MTRNSELKKLLFITLAVILLKILLDVIYTTYIYPVHSQDMYGFSYDFSYARYIVSWLLFLPIIPILYNWFDKKDLSRSIVGGLLLFSYAPATVLYSYMDSNFMWMIVLYFTVLVLSTMFLEPIRIPMGWVTRRIKKWAYWAMIFIITASILFIWGKYANFNLQLSVTDVYDTRFEARNFELPSVLKYIQANSKLVIPVIAVYALHNKKKLLFIWSLVMVYILFCIDASKSLIFIFVVGIFLYFVVKRGITFISFLSMGLVLLLIISYVAYEFFGFEQLYLYIIRRLIYVPSSINYYFYDFFSEHPLNYYLIVNRDLFGFYSPYDQPIPRLIGDIYAYPGISLNNGLFSDAYANLGTAGMFIVPFAIVIALKFVEGAFKNIHPAVQAVIATHFTIVFFSSSFPTILLSHGLIIICIVGYILEPYYKDVQDTKDEPLVFLRTFATDKS